MKGRRQLLCLLPALAGLGLLGCEPRPGFQATDLGTRGPGGEFVAPLRDVRGRPRQIGEFRGKVVLLSFGYTRCPDICPTALAKYAALLEQPGLDSAHLQVIFVTLDPAHDTPDRLADYVAWFHPDILALSGQPADIAAVARQFRVTAVRRPSPGALGDSIDHTTGAFAFGPDGRLRLHFAEPAGLAAMADDLRQLLAGA